MSITKKIGVWIVGRKLPLFWIGILSGMSSLLIIVAGLQYRWTKQLSEATEARIGSTLQPLMIGWQLDLYGGLSAICVALQVGPDSGAGQSWNDYLRRYVDFSHAPRSHETVENINVNSDLIKNIYIWETSDRAVPRLLRLDVDLAKIEVSDGPQGIRSLLARLQEKSSSLSSALRAWESSDASTEDRSTSNNQSSTSAPQPGDTITGWQFDEDIPALVHPIVNNRRHSLRPKKQTLSKQNPVDWIVVVLNLEYIQRRMLPDLTERYFSGRDGLEYKLAVIATGATPRLIYSSASEFPSNKDGSLDSKMNIFGPPPQSVEGNFWQTIKNSQALRQEEWRNFSAPVWFPVIRYTSKDDRWMLLLQNRTGPLEAIVTSIWRRNLMIGSVVLFLLTLGMFVIIFGSRRAQKLAKLRLDFVGSISHELFTPLAAIYCSGQNVSDGLVQTKTASAEHGSIITSQARRLIDLVEQILLFASTENGLNPYSFRPLQVLGILDEVRKNVAVLVEGTGFTVEQQVQEGLPYVLGDLSALSHCLQNLIINAVKYSGGNRWIGISASVHDVRRRRKEVRISVQDHGSGISSADLPHIFDPFFRSPKVVDAQIHGTGLGLAVAKRLAEGMRGRISVTSEVDIGSTFTLHLPVPRELDADIDCSEIDLGVQK
jgi:signal transduction histidine kinase